MMPRTAYTQATVAKTPSQEEEKKEGFFSGGKKKASTSSSSFAPGGMGGLRVKDPRQDRGGGGGRLGAYVEVGAPDRPRATGRPDQPGPPRRSEGLRDKGMAMSAAPKVQAELQAILGTLEKNKNPKRRKQDIT